MNLTNKCRASS